MSAVVGRGTDSLTAAREPNPVHTESTALPMKQKMNKTNLTIRITNEGRQILEESARRLGLNRSSFIELAIRTAAKQIEHDYMLLETHQ